MWLADKFNRFSKGCIAFLVMVSLPISAMENGVSDKEKVCFPHKLASQTQTDMPGMAQGNNLVDHKNPNTLPKKHKKRKRSQKIYPDQQSIAQLPKGSIGEMLPKIEELIQQVLQEKREKPLIVNVRLDKDQEIRLGFYQSFSELVKKYPFPFSWRTTNKGPENQDVNSSWVIELQLSSLARAREQIENDFVYKSDDREKQKINWLNIYDLVMRSGFSLEDFNFNNSLKIRLLELPGQNEEKDLMEIQQFLENRLPKDINPFHIVSIKINNTYGLTPGEFLNSCLKKIAHQAIRGIIQDIENGFLYLCLNNTQRSILDLHGKKTKNDGGYDGRNVPQAREETLAFICQAYETFQEEVTVLTGRGNHSNNGQKGVLYTKCKEWILEEPICRIIKKHFALEGNGGYKIVLEELREIDLGTRSFEKAVPLIMKLIPQMTQKGQSRLRLRMETIPLNQKHGYGQEYELMMCLIENLALHNPALFDSISPFSFETKPGALQIIFNHVHPRYPNTMCCGNYHGIPVNKGTIIYNHQRISNKKDSSRQLEANPNQALLKSHSISGQPSQIQNSTTAKRDDHVDHVATTQNTRMINSTLLNGSQDEIVLQRNNSQHQEDTQESIYEKLYSFGSMVALPVIGVGVYFLVSKSPWFYR